MIGSGKLGILFGLKSLGWLSLFLHLLEKAEYVGPFSLPIFSFIEIPLDDLPILLVIKLHDYILYILLRNVLLCIFNFYTC